MSQSLKSIGEERGDSPDDVYVFLNVSRLIEMLMSIEEMARAARREDANRLFLKALKNEVFSDGE